MKGKPIRSHGFGSMKPKPINDNIKCQRIDPYDFDELGNFENGDVSKVPIDQSVFHTDLVEKL